MKIKYAIRYMMVILSLLFVSNSSLLAEWDPEFISIDDRMLGIEILQTPGLKEYENKICSYLNGSWCSEEKAKLIFELTVLTRPNICVEIGAFQGSCTLPMVGALKYLNHGFGYVIDAWSNKETVKDLPPDDPHTKWWSTIDMNAVKNQCMQMIKSWSLKPYCKVYHSPSTTVAPKIGTIDFLHLDGNFSEQGALNDTLHYLPKVRSGGYILMSNLLFVIGNQATKKKALWPIFDACEIICELDNSNVILFRKR